MKYKFVYDKGIEELFNIELSSEEWGIVLATIVGKHNAMFFGYRPERLVNAIKKLSECICVVADSKSLVHHDYGFFRDHFVNAVEGKGTIFVPYINTKSTLFYDTLRLAASDDEREYNIVVYDTNKPVVGGDAYYDAFLKHFDIIYECKESNVFHTSLTDMKCKLDGIKHYRRSLHSGSYISSKFEVIEQYWVHNDCYFKYRALSKENPNLALKYMRVARSISDIRINCMTSLTDLDDAIRIYYKEDPVRIPVCHANLGFF